MAAWTPPQVTHTWTVENLTAASFTSATPNALLTGPVFEACGLRWRLYVVFNLVAACQESAAETKIVFLGLQLLDRTLEPVRLADASLRVHGVHGVENPHQLNRSFWLRSVLLRERGGRRKAEESWSGTALRHAKLVRDESTVLPGGVLTITVTLRGRSYAELTVPELPEPSLVAEVAAALPAAGAAPPDGADVVFAASGERVWAHSFVLATRSLTLRAALWGPLSHRHAGAAGAPLYRELELPGGVDVSTFRRVLQFMYTDSFPDFATSPLSDAEISALLQSSDYLGVEHLKVFCMAELQKRLTVDNAVATLQLAHALLCLPLKDAVLRFIAADAHAVMRSPSWAELAQDQALLQAVMTTLATGEPPKVIIPEPAGLDDEADDVAAAAS